MPRLPRTISAPTRWLVGVLVAVLAIGTIALVALALQSVRPEPVDAPIPEPSFTRPAPSAPTTTPSETATPAPVSTSGTGADAAYPGEQQRLLSVGSGGWWRATAGACDGPAPLVEHSSDAGATWTDVTPRYRDIAEVVTLDTFAETEAQLVALMGTACEVQALRTFTQGEFWAPYDEVLEASRYLDPAEPASVALPGGAIAAPCAEPSSFRAAGGVVALVCDGTASVLADDDTWAPLAATDAVALTIDDGTVLTAAVAPGCEGLAVTRWSGDGFTSGEDLGCASGADPAAPVAIAAVGEAAVLWSGDTLTPLG